MTIPAYTSLLLPILQTTGDGAAYRLTDIAATLADYFGLTAEERAALTPNGKQLKFNHRVQYAVTHLRKAGFLTSPARGVVQITRLGVSVLETKPLYIDYAFLMQFQSFIDFVTRTHPERTEDAEPLEYVEPERTPAELMHILHLGVQKELADEVLGAIMAASPAFFEQLVIDLLVAMGYGDKGHVQRLGRSGDGGVDGVLQADKLGLDVVYVQAKRFARQHPVGRPLVQAFIGSLIGQGAQRGVMLTTSRYTQDAIDYARSMQQHKIILIDGEQLPQLMIEHNVGVQVEATYTLKRLNRDYFHEA